MAHVVLEKTVRPNAASSTAITVDALTKTFPAPGAKNRFTVLDAISLTVGEGEFVTIVGPSGCGKSTLLNIIAGLERYEGGSVVVAPRAGKGGAEPRIGD